MGALTQHVVRGAKPKDQPYELRDDTLRGLILRVQPSGWKSYVVEYGRGRRLTLGRADVMTLAQARREAARILGEVAAGKTPTSRRKKTTGPLTLGGFIEGHYGPWVLEHRRSGRATLNRLKACFGGLWDRELAQINAWLVEKWRTERLRAGTKPTTLNRDVTALKAALSKAVEWGHLKEHPLASIKPLKTDSAAKVRFLTDEEERRLRSALDSRPLLRVLVLLALNTGLRRGELFNLRWEDVDLARGFVTVAGTGAKSGRTRHVPLNAEARRVLEGWRHATGGEGLVFPSRAGGTMTNVKRSWGSALREAQISGFRFHDLRHTFASRLVMQGVDLNTVRELLGHADLKMTLRYAHLAPEHKAAAVELLVRS